MEFDMDYDMERDMDYDDSTDVEDTADNDVSDVGDSYDDSNDIAEEDAIDFDAIPCLDTEPESEELELEDLGGDLFIEDTYEDSDLDVMLAKIEDQTEDLEDMNDSEELERMLAELEDMEEEEDDAFQKVYGKRYPR